MEFHEKFERCMVMAGGGFRFGYYFGMHAAAVETGNKPDILLGSCGGAIAAAVIAALPDDRARRAWLASSAMHRFFRGITTTPRAKILPVMHGLLRRQLQRGAAPIVPDLFDDYLFELPDMPPVPCAVTTPATPVAIIGAKMLFQRGDVGSPRAERKLFRETVFCGTRAASLLKGTALPPQLGIDGDSAIAPGLEVDTVMPLNDALRISIADAYYFPCHSLPQGNYSGGLIDLFPIEIARQLARHVVMERKARFNGAYALPAIRAVFGIDGNARSRNVYAEYADIWVNTSDAANSLGRACIGKRIDWRRNRVCLEVPVSSGCKLIRGSG